MEIPEGWDRGPLKSIASVSSGGTPSRAKPEYWGGDIPWVSTSEIDYNVLYDTKEKITAEGLEQSSAKFFPSGTILMAMYGQGKTRGKVCLLGVPATTNQACAAIKFKKEYNSDYYFYFFQHNYLRIRDLSNSGGQENLSAAIIKILKVPLPPLPEQRRIAEILGTWDRAIAATEALIAKSEAQKKALMQQLLTGKRRLPGFEGEWKDVRLTDIAEVTTGGSNREDSELVGEFVFFDRSTDVRRSSRYLFDTEAVIVGGEGQEFVPKYFEGKFDLHQRAYAIHTSKQFSIRYLYYIIHYKRHLLRRFAVGSTVASLRMGTFTKIPVPDISLAEQKAVTAILDNSSYEIQALQAKLQTLKTEKAALMQQLLTGKRRVKLTEDAA